jgi:hypothetical protein
MKLGSQRRKLMLFCLVLSAMISLFFAITNDIEFTRIVDEKQAPIDFSDSCWYNETILVKNMPKNHLKRGKIMIAYVDSVGLSRDDLSKMPGIKNYCVSFYKQTRHTIKYFMKNEYSGRNAFRDIAREKIGAVHMVRCEKDPTRWGVRIQKDFGEADLHGYPELVSYALFDECMPLDLGSYEARDELGRYYMELQIKKKTSFFVNVDGVEFTRFIDGRVLSDVPPDSSWYGETVLVKNMPKDHLERCKIMIAYVDSVGLS